MEEYFSKKNISRLFEEKKVGVKSVTRRRESPTIEFKENFNMGSISQYAKTFAAFSNHKGGYLIFGIRNLPHELVGMKDDNFEQNDPSKITQFLNTHFSPTIEWYSYIHNVGDSKFGIFYIVESQGKPVIAISPDARGQLKEGDIFYRYSGQSKKIRGIDLQKLIHSRIIDERKQWQEMLRKMTTIVPKRAGILDLSTGKLLDEKRKILIDEKLINKLRFIKEGSFREKEGAPALKLTGDISGGVFTAKVPVPMSINRELIINSFLNKECSNPLEFIKHLPYEATFNLPIWFFISRIDMPIDNIKAIIKKLKYTNSMVKNKLLKRLDSENINYYKLGRTIKIQDKISNKDFKDFNKTVSEIIKKNNLLVSRKRAVERSLVRIAIVNGVIDEITNYEFIEDHTPAIIESITHLDKQIINSKESFIIALLKTMNELELPSNQLGNFRRSLCYVDVCLYKNS